MSYRVIHIETLSDPGLEVFSRLTEAQIRNKLEPEQGIFIAESFKVIDRALEARYRPLKFLILPKWLDKACECIRVAQEKNVLEPECDFEIYVARADILRELCGYTLTRGALCAFRRPLLPSPADLLRESRNVAVLEGITDHTNVGAIFRSAAALGVDAVLLSPTCCDPLYRRSVRVSMGCVFQVPWTYLGLDHKDWPASGLKTLHDYGFTTLAFALSDDALTLDDPRLANLERLAMIFGTEGDGLCRKTIEGSDLCVRIPMTHGVDSLNVAAASAVAFWQLCRT